MLQSLQKSWFCVAFLLQESETIVRLKLIPNQCPDSAEHPEIRYFTSLSLSLFLLRSCQEAWLAAATMWEEPPANGRCSSPAKPESPSFFPSLPPPPILLHIWGRKDDYHQPAVIQCPDGHLPPALHCRSVKFRLSKVAILLTAVLPRQGTRAWSQPCYIYIYAPLTAYALKWDSLVSTECAQWLSTWNNPKSNECMDRSWHLHDQKWSQIHSTSREQDILRTLDPTPNSTVQRKSAEAAYFKPTLFSEVWKIRT